MTRRVDREFEMFRVWPREREREFSFAAQNEATDPLADRAEVARRRRMGGPCDGDPLPAWDLVTRCHEAVMEHLRARPALPGREGAREADAGPWEVETVYPALVVALKHGGPARSTAAQRAALVSLLLLPAFARLCRAPLSNASLSLHAVVDFIDRAMERRDLWAVGAMLSLHPSWFADADAMLAVLVASLPTQRVRTLRARRAAFAKRAAESLARAGWSETEVREALAGLVLAEDEEREETT